MKMSIKSLMVASGMISGVALAQETMDLKVSTTVPPIFYHKIPVG